MSTEARLSTLARAEWPELRRVPLNPGTLGVPSLRVRQAMREACDADERFAWPLGSYASGREGLARARTLAGEVWGGPPVAIAGGTTSLVNHLVLSLSGHLRRERPAEAPYVVLTSGHEHEGGISGFEAHPDFRVVYAPDESLSDPQRFADVARAERPHVIFLSQCTWTDGRLLDTRALIQAARALHPEAWAIVDAAQVVGNGLPDLEGGDLTLASAHKWLCGPAGTGFAWVHARAREALAWSWTGHALDPESPLARFEAMGGQDFARLHGVAASIDLLKQAGREAAEARSAGLSRLLATGLHAELGACGIPHAFLDPFSGRWSEETPEKLAGIVTVRFPEWDPYPAYAALDARGVHLKCIKGRTPTGTVLQQWRLGVPWHTSEDQLGRALHTLREVLRGS